MPLQCPFPRKHVPMSRDPIPPLRMQDSLFEPLCRSGRGLQAFVEFARFGFRGICQYTTAGIRSQEQETAGARVPLGSSDGHRGFFAHPQFCKGRASGRGLSGRLDSRAPRAAFLTDRANTSTASTNQGHRVAQGFRGP